MLNKKEPLEIIKRIYEGNIEFDDKPFVNTECDKIYMEIEEVRKKNIYENRGSKEKKYIK